MKRLLLAIVVLGLVVVGARADAAIGHGRYVFPHRAAPEHHAPPPQSPGWYRSAQDHTGRNGGAVRERSEIVLVRDAVPEESGNDGAFDVYARAPFLDDRPDGCRVPPWRRAVAKKRHSVREV